MQIIDAVIEYIDRLEITNSKKNKYLLIPFFRQIPLVNMKYLYLYKTTNINIYKQI